MTEILDGLKVIMDGLIQFFGYIPQCLDYISTVISHMPVPLTSFMMIVITGLIVLLIVGRNA